MKAANILAAATLAVAASGAFAETGVKLTQIDNVANVYGRAAVATVKVKGEVQTAGAQADRSGRKIVANRGTLVGTADAVDGGRS